MGTFFTIEDKLNVVEQQLQDILSSDTNFGKNPFDVTIQIVDTMPTFNIAFIRISYDPCKEDQNYTSYRDSYWFQEELEEPLTQRSDDIEVSIVNLTNEYNDPINEQLIIIA